MTRRTILHLCDDQTAGGVTRVLEHLTTCPIIAASGDSHITKFISRGTARLGRLKADVIVSHLSVSWRMLPTHITLRATNPTTPLVHVEHSYTQSFLDNNVRHEGRFKTLLRTVYALYDRIIAVSFAQGRWLTDARLVRPRLLDVIQSTTSYKDLRALPARSGPARILALIGRLDRQKGFDTAITAFRQTPNPKLRLRIYGNGPEKNNLTQLALGDARISFEGHHSDPCEIYGSVDAVLMPSRREAFGLVAAEALAARRVVLAHKVDGLADHAECGAIMLASEDPVVWAHAIENLTHTAPKLDASHASATTPEQIFAAAWEHLIDTLCHPSKVPTKHEYNVLAT
ncbi:Glycosyltransferase involved in cell wall bisynthesis [Aliiroseovarius halocynthiae]|nr:glycosyltransferase [Aliiroseovarius halocynthiae]SMR72779.1 Glycosyltransferase involved in cell wall bisynthesis [Aliiroseovarius halocynthiae]